MKQSWRWSSIVSALLCPIICMGSNNPSVTLDTAVDAGSGEMQCDGSFVLDGTTFEKLRIGTQVGTGTVFYGDNIGSANPFTGFKTVGPNTYHVRMKLESRLGMVPYIRTSNVIDDVVIANG